MNCLKLEITQGHKILLVTAKYCMPSHTSIYRPQVWLDLTVICSDSNALNSFKSEGSSALVLACCGDLALLS